MSNPTPITCDAARDFVHRSCDDELPAAEQVLLAHHVATCHACREFSGHMASVIGAMHRLRAVSQPLADDFASPPLAARLATTLAARQPSRGAPLITPLPEREGQGEGRYPNVVVGALRPRWPRIAAYVSGIAAVLAILISAFHSTAPNPPTRTDIATAPGDSRTNPPTGNGGVGGGPGTEVLNVALASADRPPISLANESAARLLAVELTTTQPDVRIIGLFEKVTPPPPDGPSGDGARRDAQHEPRFAANITSTWRLHDDAQ